MEKAELTSLNQERLERWCEKLVSLNCTATVLIGIGHGPASGDIHVITLEDIDDKFLLGLLQYGALELAGRI